MSGKGLCGLVYGFVITLIMCAAAQGDNGNAYVLGEQVDLRNGPNVGTDVVDSLSSNESVIIMDAQGEWVRVMTVTGASGWLRRDWVSDLVVVIGKQDRTLVVERAGEIVLSAEVIPGPGGLASGRYFMTPQPGRLAVSWPNRNDLRSFLLSGSMSYDAYKRSVLHPPAGTLSLCPSAASGPKCGALVEPGEYAELERLAGRGIRLDVYESSAEAARWRGLDEFPRRVFLGALEELEHPVAGLGPGGRSPSMAYPGGDIQPDFATSADIVIRAVRRAGLDLQPLVHEDRLLHPQRYADLPESETPTADHRRIPVLHRYLTHHALSLPLDTAEDPFSFEAGDIVLFATGQAGDRVPDRMGIVSESYDANGLPRIITVWDMGQSTGQLDILGRDSIPLVGHFRLAHIYEYY